MVKIPDGYYVYWDGNTAIVYGNKRYTLLPFIKMCRDLGLNNNEVRDWLDSDKHRLKILDPLWDQIKKLPLVEDKEEIVAPEEEGQVERYGAYTRINPSGHREQVIKKKGKTDEETLNELADSLMQLLESSPETSMPPGECWYCGKPKDNIYGLCMGCGRFGKPGTTEPQIEPQVPWEGPDPTVGAEKVFTPHQHGMSSEQDYIRRQNNTRAGYAEPMEPFNWDKWDRGFEESANHLNDYTALAECTEEYIWKCVSDSLAEEIREWPGFNELVDKLIGDGLAPEEIVRQVDAAYWDD